MCIKLLGGHPGPGINPGKSYHAYFDNFLLFSRNKNTGGKVRNFLKGQLLSFFSNIRESLKKSSLHFLSENTRPDQNKKTETYNIEIKKKQKPK